jgi:hypothetical protein
VSVRIRVASLSRLVTRALLVINLAPPSNAGAQDDTTLREAIEVTELSVLADVPARRGVLGRDPVGASDVEVYEDGILREVTHIDEEPEASWRVLVWIDGQRCEASWIKTQLAALGAASDEIAAVGRAEVRIADPIPRFFPEPLRPADWAELGRNAEETYGCHDLPRERAERLRRSGRMREALEAVVAGNISRNDRLLRFAGNAGFGKPALLILISLGYDLEPQLRYAASERPPNADRYAQRAGEALAKLGAGLAEGGWTVVVPAVSERTEDWSRGVPGGVPTRPPADQLPWRVWPRRSRGQLRLPADYGVFGDFTLGPWRRVASMTAGAVGASSQDLKQALSGVQSKRRVWYRSTRPRPGESREVVLRLRDSDGQPIAAPVRLPAPWTSTAIAAARVRSGETGEGLVPWTVDYDRTAWQVRSQDDGEAPRRARWSLVINGDSTPEFHLADLGAVARLPPDDAVPPGARLYLEDLETGAWMATR